MVVGGQYAIEDRGLGWRPDAHRVTVVKVGPGAAVKVKVIDRAIGGDGRRWRRGRLVEVTARDLACTWEAWQERLAAREAEAAATKERWREWEEDRARAVEPDPARSVPDRYDGEFLAEHEPYGQQLEAAVRAGGHSWRRVLPAALDLLPEAVQRDVVAAATADPDTFASAAAPVSRRAADVFASAAACAVLPMVSLPPERALADYDEAFVDACLASVRGGGGDLDLPFVPRLRHDDPVGGLRVVRPPLGWLRVAYGPTGGDKLHAPHCSRIRADETSPPTMPMWRTAAGEVCGSCGGPGIRPTPAWVAFRAASDAWVIRDRAVIEEWQVRALLHLVADAAVTRAREGEPDRPRDARILDALAEDMPGPEGWAAYRLVHRFSRERPAGVERHAAARLAFRRLRQLADVLPEPARPPVPFPLDNAAADGNVPGDPAAVDRALQQWHDDLDHAAEVDGLDLVLFGLPGVHTW